MSLEDLKECLEATGLPLAYRSFMEEQKPPFICYLVAYSNNFYADGRTYQKINRVQVELYTKYKDLEAEDKVEQALSCFAWEKSEDYIDAEQVYQIIYEVEV